MAGQRLRPQPARASGAPWAQHARSEADHQACCQTVLLGAKYPHCAVNGLLVAEKQEPRKEHLPLGGPGAHRTLFVGCTPLVHGTPALAPMREVALTLTDSRCKDDSYVIAGYYQANERVKDAGPNQAAEKAASRIAEGFSDTAVVMVDNTQFTWDCVVPTIHVYEHRENKRRTETRTVIPGKTGQRPRGSQHHSWTPVLFNARGFR